MSETTVRVEGLRVAFGGKEALSGVDFEARRGEAAVLLGRSGSGKTTFLRALNRLNEVVAPGCRTEGEVRLFLEGAWRGGREKEFPVERLRQKAAMVFQSPNLLPTTVGKNLTLPLRAVAGTPRAEENDRVRAALAAAHLWEEVGERLDAPASTLSGGQQQRLCLARALILEPEILLLDEPTASLDFRTASRIEELLSELKARFTLVIVSHSLGQARRLADRVHVFHDGRIGAVIEGSDLGGEATLRTLVEELF